MQARLKKSIEATFATAGGAVLSASADVLVHRHFEGHTLLIGAIVGVYALVTYLRQPPRERWGN